MNGLAVTRAQVHAALVAGLAGLLEADSIHDYAPDELALPTVWIGSPFGIREGDPSSILAEVAVIVAVDGAEQAQLVALDALEAAVWVALDNVGRSRLAIGSQLLVGGPTVHAVTVTADVDVDVRTLCPPTLELTGVR